MTQPHQCRCAICGEIGTILPGLPNVFAEVPNAIVPTETNHTVEVRTSNDLPVSPYASSRADELAPRGEPPYAEVATCFVHGYARCMICKFPTP